jgi:hypothetical protein
MWSAISRRAMSVQSDLTAPSAHRRRSKATSAPARLDFLTSSFVFIDIPGSVVKKVESRELRVDKLTPGSHGAAGHPGVCRLQLRASCVVPFQPPHNPIVVYHCGHRLSSVFFANSRIQQRRVRECRNRAKMSLATAVSGGYVRVSQQGYNSVSRSPFDALSRQDVVQARHGQQAGLGHSGSKLPHSKSQNRRRT